MAKTTRPAIFPKASKMVPQKAEVAEMPSFDATVGETELPSASALTEALAKEELPIEPLPLDEMGAIPTPSEEVAFTATATEVQPFATPKQSGGKVLDTVALKKGGRIIVQAVSRKQAESIVKNNPAIEIA